MFVSQPTISKMVKGLEEELAVVLFERNGRTIKLTDVGERIYNQSQNIIDSFANLTDEIDQLKLLQTGTIQLGMPPMVGASFFPAVIYAFRKKYPRVKIEIIEDGARALEEKVEKGMIDIGVSVLPMNSEHFDYIPFACENLKVVVPINHHLSQKETVRLQELANESFILYRKDFTLHERIIVECVRSGFQPKIAYESAQWDFISEMVATGLGVALLPESICKRIDGKLQTIPLIEPAIPWDLAMIWRKEHYLSFAAREWVAFCSEWFKEGLEETFGEEIDDSK